jgi:hypothetical protein
MKKIFGIFVCFLMSAASFALDVNKGELESAQNDSIQFENYGGPHAVIESRSAIMGIGTHLGEEVSKDIENPQAVEPYAKYSVYHVVGGIEENRLDADILFLNASAGVDHITNLRRILTGYLMAAYGYSQEDAETLSIFITVYNAIYRGQLEQFSSKYKSAVLTYLTEDSVGLSKNWEEWAGKTQLVIPLGEISEGTASVETSEISDENVLEAMRNDEDKAVEVREKLTEMKEKEAETATEKAKTAQKEAAQEKKDGNKEAAKESAKEATEQQKIADKKTEEVKKEREQLAKDKNEIQKEEAKKAALESQPHTYLTSLFVVDEKNRLYSLMTVNPETGVVIKKSSLKQIREKTIFPVSEGFVAVCGVNDKHSAVKICLVSGETLEIIKESEETLSENTSLVQHGDNFYVIINQDGKNYLAAYDKNLNLKAKSDVVINGSSPLNLYTEGILVTDGRGNPVLLSLPGLSPVWTANASVIDAK